MIGGSKGFFLLNFLQGGAENDEIQLEKYALSKVFGRLRYIAIYRMSAITIIVIHLYHNNRNIDYHDNTTQTLIVIQYKQNLIFAQPAKCCKISI